MKWTNIKANEALSLDAIADSTYVDFRASVREELSVPENRALAYFATPSKDGLRFYCIMGTDLEARVACHTLDYYAAERPESLGVTSMQLFEREIGERYGVIFRGHPWFKPVRYPFDRFDPRSTIDNYPFYGMDSHELHEVNVGPIHAGIIEPGAFRFICDGERIVNLEIALGYQHRGVESQICGTTNSLRQIALAETIAGDTTIGHATVMAQITERGSSGELLAAHRRIALEMERIAMHLADIGALCMDLAYQLGQVASEALRTMVINTMQRWSGSRFGRGLIRPAGSYFMPDYDDILSTLATVVDRFKLVSEGIFSTPTVLARLEEICIVSRATALEIGAIGMAARSSGLRRDARGEEMTLIETEGDLASRLRLRSAEIIRSYDMIRTDIARARTMIGSRLPEPDYDVQLPPSALIFSNVEAWRGEIVHCAITDRSGNFEHYRIYDPSFHNWLMLAMSVRGAQISDFPVSNKSFNLSYAGHDL